MASEKSDKERAKIYYDKNKEEIKLKVKKI